MPTAAAAIITCQPTDEKKRKGATASDNDERSGPQKKRRRYECSADGCSNKVVKGGVCVRHGAKKERKQCIFAGCKNKSQKGGVCIKHGAKHKRCSVAGCPNQVRRRGVCYRHGAYSDGTPRANIQVENNLGRDDGNTVSATQLSDDDAGGTQTRGVDQKGTAAEKLSSKLTSNNSVGEKDEAVLFEKGPITVANREEPHQQGDDGSSDNEASEDEAPTYTFNGKRYASYQDMCNAKRKRNQDVLDQSSLLQSYKRPPQPVANNKINKRRQTSISKKPMRRSKRLSGLNRLDYNEDAASTESGDDVDRQEEEETKAGTKDSVLGDEEEDPLNDEGRSQTENEYEQQSCNDPLKEGGNKEEDEFSERVASEREPLGIGGSWDEGEHNAFAAENHHDESGEETSRESEVEKPQTEPNVDSSFLSQDIACFEPPHSEQASEYDTRLEQEVSGLADNRVDVAVETIREGETSNKNDEPKELTHENYIWQTQQVEEEIEEERSAISAEHVEEMRKLDDDKAQSKTEQTKVADGLKARLDEIMEQMSRLEKQRLQDSEEWKAEKQKMQTEHAKIVQQKEREINHAVDEQARLKEKIKEAAERQQELDTQLVEAAEKYGHLKRENGLVEQRLSHLEQLSATLESNMAAAHSKKIQIQSELDDAHVELEKKTEEVSNQEIEFAFKLKEATDRCETLEQANSNLQQQLVDLGRQIEDANSIQAAQQSEMQEVRGRLSSESENVAELRSQLEARTREAAQKDRRYEHLKAVKDELAEEKEALVEEKEALVEEKEALEMESDRRGNEIDQLRDQVDNLTRRLGRRAGVRNEPSVLEIVGDREVPTRRTAADLRGGNLPDELSGLDRELVDKILNEIVDRGQAVKFNHIAGLENAKNAINQLVTYPMKRPDLFASARDESESAGADGLLLFGPPGTGKTMIGKAIAHESGATFFSMSSSALKSKWHGEGEKLVKTLFDVAYYLAPSVIFMDEIDSLLSQRKTDEDDGMRGMKTEFLVQFDGASNERMGQVLVIGATNLPQDLDDAALRRFAKRLYIPLPDEAGREALLRNILAKMNHSLTHKNIAKLVRYTKGYSGADMSNLFKDAKVAPIMRSLAGKDVMRVIKSDIPPVAYQDFRRSLKGSSPSVAQAKLQDYIKWNNTYGTRVSSYLDEDFSDESSDDETDD